MKTLFKTTFLAASLCLLFNSASAFAITEAETVRFLNHATYGATSEDIKVVQRIGMDAWIYQQLKKPQCKHYDANAPVADSIPENKQMRDKTWWTSAMVCNDQLRQRVAFALSEIFVVSDNDGTLNRHQDGLESYYDTLATHSLGNFRDLLKAVSLHPVMGSYLSMRGNEKANAANNIRPDENYARELMQLFTIGLVNLNMDGMPVKDNKGTIPSYSQTDISELARVLTGWTWKGVDTKDKWDALKKRKRPDINQDYINPMIAVVDYHDTEKKTLLGKNIQRNLSPEADLDRALDILFSHPNTAPFISKQLIQRLVKSNPSPAYVRRVASVFHNNGSGIRGDMPSVVRAILTDGEALSGQREPGKLIEPMLRVTQLWRAFSATTPIDQAGKAMPFFLSAPDSSLGQSPLSAPSVFNFFEPTYAPSALKELPTPLVAPEFQLINSSLLPRLNNRLAALALNGYSDPDEACNDSSDCPQGFKVRLNYDNYLPLLKKPDELIEKLNILLMSGRMDSSMRVILLDFIKELQARKVKIPERQIIAEVVHMIIISPQYAIQW